MANSDTGTGRLRIDFVQDTDGGAIDEIWKYLETERLFSDSMDFEAYSSETESVHSLIMTTESGCDCGQYWKCIESMARADSSLGHEARATFLMSSLTGSCYDWDSSYRYLIIKKAGSLKSSLLEHEGVKLAWPEVINALRSGEHFSANELKNSITNASLFLVHESRDQKSSPCIFSLSTQGLSGYVLMRSEALECVFVDAESEACSAPAELWDSIAQRPSEALSLDEVSNSREAKDDLLSGLNMYSLVKGDPMSDGDIEAAINMKYSIDEPADDELAAALARWS